jgi:hypothetical protein
MARDGNTLAAAGAHSLAATIRAYWKNRGHTVDTRIEVIAIPKGDALHCVRSDLVGGLPNRTEQPPTS